MTSDAGSGLCAVHKAVLSDLPWQSDTVHGMAHRLGDDVRRLEKSAYTPIKVVDDREKKRASAKSERMIDKPLLLCFNADRDSEQAINLYDDFSYRYTTLIPQLNIFDAKGHFRQYNQVEGDMMRRE